MITGRNRWEGILRWWSRNREKQPQSTPVSSMRSFWGLMHAYWLSDRWQEAWWLTAIIVALTALSAMASVWFAEASGELVSAIAFLHNSQNATTLSSLLASAATLAGIVVLKEVGFHCGPTLLLDDAASKVARLARPALQ